MQSVVSGISGSESYHNVFFAYLYLTPLYTHTHTHIKINFQPSVLFPEEEAGGGGGHGGKDTYPSIKETQNSISIKH